MREIKFRAWDEIEKGMFEVVSIDFKEKTVRLFVPAARPRYESGRRTITKSDLYELGDKRDFPTRPLNEIALMQFISLKDKNDKEIYEGDIVKGKDGMLVKYQGRVVYETYSGRMCIIPGHLALTMNLANRCEVIGNVHEGIENESE